MTTNVRRSRSTPSLGELRLHRALVYGAAGAQRVHLWVQAVICCPAAAAGLQSEGGAYPFLDPVFAACTDKRAPLPRRGLAEGTSSEKVCGGGAINCCSLIASACMKKGASVRCFDPIPINELCSCSDETLKPLQSGGPTVSSLARMP